MSIVCKEGLRGMSSDSMETASSKEGRGVCIIILPGLGLRHFQLHFLCSQQNHNSSKNRNEPNEHECTEYRTRRETNEFPNIKSERNSRDNNGRAGKE